ncbi:MAG: SH3 domain-containing protein [Novosphingobium sp.]
MFDTGNLDGKTFALLGPMKLADPAHTAVRGDLAHIALAGRYFVPHYAVPQPRKIAAGGAALRAASRSDADTLAQLPGGSDFAVLDIAGPTAWGQAGGEFGLVGYVALDRLEASA